MRSIAHFSTWICAEASQILCAEWEIRRASLGVKRFGKEVTMKIDFHTHGKLAKKAAVFRGLYELAVRGGEKGGTGCHLPDRAFQYAGI